VPDDGGDDPSKAGKQGQGQGKKAHPPVQKQKLIKRRPVQPAPF
jgi:hypothetical protein